MSVSILRKATSRIEVGDEAALLVAKLSVALLRFIGSEQRSDSGLINRLCMSAREPAFVFLRGAIRSIEMIWNYAKGGGEKEMQNNFCFNSCTARLKVARN